MLIGSEEHLERRHPIDGMNYAEISDYRGRTAPAGGERLAGQLGAWIKKKRGIQRRQSLRQPRDIIGT
jgi:hypothetical protein